MDIHTHMYPPAYVGLLESRQTIPLIRRFAGAKDPRYIILPAEAESLEKINQAGATATTTQLPGRPVTTHYSSLQQKIHFMDTHKIDISVISLANPWLDFVAEAEAAETARSVNREFESMCLEHPGRLFFFATLPLSAPAEELLAAIDFVRGLKHCRGVILGTSGLGQGLDDLRLIPVFKALAKNGLMIFLHPVSLLIILIWSANIRSYECPAIYLC